MIHRRDIKHILFTFFYLFTPLISMGFCSCHDVSEDIPPTSKITVQYAGDSLRILVLGNSFSVDGTAYMEEIVHALHLDHQRFCLYNGFIGSGGIQEWTDTFNAGDTVKLTRMAGGIDMIDVAPLKELIRQPWEVCVILQGSHQSYKWNSFEQRTPHLISLIKSLCPNQQVKIAYAMPWSHTVVNTPTELPGNIKCTWKLYEEHAIDIIIPVGIAIQNAREAHLDNGKYLTRDDWHICYGAGRYIAACTWYEALLEPFFHVSILDSDVLHPLTTREQEDPTSLPVDETNRRLCQQCAYQAVQSPLKVTELSGK